MTLETTFMRTSTKPNQSTDSPSPQWVKDEMQKGPLRFMIQDREAKEAADRQAKREKENTGIPAIE